MCNTNYYRYTSTFTPRIDVSEDEKKIYFDAELAGVDKNDVKVSIDDVNVLTIKGEKKPATGTHRSINDVAWNEFVNQLKYKAEEAGSSVILVNPRNTTKACSSCGRLVDKDLSQRIHKCSCGHTEDRDSNASKNILAVGLHSLGVLKKAS